MFSFILLTETNVDMRPGVCICEHACIFYFAFAYVCDHPWQSTMAMCVSECTKPALSCLCDHPIDTCQCVIACL